MTTVGETSRVAVVIGGTKGIGRATALALARDGYRVVVCSRGQPDVDALIGEGRDAGRQVDGRVCDVGDEAALDAFIDWAGERFGRIDALVFAAGKAFSGSALSLSLEEWDACFRINLRAPFVAVKRALPRMIASGGGSIVFVSSIWALTTPRDRLAYLTVKSGLPALARGLAVDHGDDGIRANVVAPGYVETAFLHQSLAALHGEQELPRLLDEILRAHPLGRMVTPAEVADVIGFLASDRASGMSGQTLVVDGASTTRFSLADMWKVKEG